MCLPSFYYCSVPVKTNGPCGSTINERTSVVSATAAVENWTQVTAYVTAPADYYADDNSANSGLTGKYYTRVIGMGISDSTNGTVVSIDNVTITPVSSAQVSAYALFVNSGDAPLADAQGNEMAPGSVVYKKNGSERTAFRFLSSFDYYTDGTDMYLDEAKTTKILKRGMLVGIYDGTKYTQKAKSEVAAGAAAWTNDGKTLEYSFKIYNISVNNKNTVYYATPYLIVDVGGVQQTITGQTKQNSVQGIYDMSSAKEKGYSWYPELTVNDSDFMHISFDDVSTSFSNLANNTYESLYDEPFFGWLQGLNTTYGAKFSLYTYTNSLDSVPNAYAEEFTAAADWLKIGLHADNANSNFGGYTEEQGKASWNAFVEEITRITGTTDSIDTMPRLHTFAGSEAALKGMASANTPATGFLSADDSRISYYFTEEIRDYLYDNDYITDNVNNLVFVATDLRGDWFDGTGINTYKKPVAKTVYDELKYRYTDSSFATSRGCYIFFTHEWKVYDGESLNSKKAWVEDACKFAKDYNLSIDFPMNKTYAPTDYDIN